MLNFALLLLVCFSIKSMAFAADKKDVHKAESAFKTPNSKVEVKRVPIKMWTSREGGKKLENVLQDVDIGGLYFDNLVAYDIQYEATLRFKGLKLRDLISQYKPIPQGFDFILLHSKKGMIIPVSIASLRADTEVFIALATYDEPAKKWSTTFSPGVFSQPDRGEKISVSFENNKMVVGANWRHTDFSITPWRFFDSLAGIEVVSSFDYYKALETKGSSSQLSGRSVYMRRCQYCHGVDSFGAKAAPDFVKLFPKKHDVAVKMIMNKVLPLGDGPTVSKANLSRMPKQPDFKKSEASDLAKWITEYAKSN